MQFLRLNVYAMIPLALLCSLWAQAQPVLSMKADKLTNQEYAIQVSLEGIDPLSVLNQKILVDNTVVLEQECFLSQARIQASSESYIISTVLELSNGDKIDTYQGINYAASSGSIEVDLVQVFVSADGNVKDVDDNMWQIYENDKRQKIEVVEDVSSINVAVGVMIDVSESMNGRLLKRAKTSARRFLDRIADKERDRVFLAQFNKTIAVTVPFTSDHGLVKDKLSAFSSAGGTDIRGAIMSGVNYIEQNVDPALFTRKVLVVITDGHDWSEVPDEQIRSFLAGKDTTVYIISVGDVDGVLHLDLDYLVETSDGKHIFAKNMRLLQQAFDQLHASIKSQIMLGYYSNLPPRDLGWREIDVRIEGQKRIQLNHRKGYLKEAPKDSSVLRVGSDNAVEDAAAPINVDSPDELVAESTALIQQLKSRLQLTNSADEDAKSLARKLVQMGEDASLPQQTRAQSFLRSAQLWLALAKRNSSVEEFKTAIRLLQTSLHTDRSNIETLEEYIGVLAKIRGIPDEHRRSELLKALEIEIRQEKNFVRSSFRYIDDSVERKRVEDLYYSQL
jgi:VWFA-related protein